MKIRSPGKQNASTKKAENSSSALDGANYIVAMFSDLTKRVTLQNLYNDGGFSNIALSQEISETFEK
jgi:enoyl-[acyl-carrier protein] reductase I